MVVGYPPAARLTSTPALSLPSARSAATSVLSSAKSTNEIYRRHWRVLLDYGAQRQGRLMAEPPGSAACARLLQ